MITIPTGDLTGVLADVIPFAFPKDDFPMLNVVRIEWDGKALHALTTDRYRVGWSTWEPGDVGKYEEVQDDLFTQWGSGDDPWKCTLALADAAEIAKVFKLGAKELQVPLAVDYEADRRRLTVKRTKETGHSAITISAEDTFDTNFPDVRKVLADCDKLAARRDVSYTAAFLADFAKVRARGLWRCATPRPSPTCPSASGSSGPSCRPAARWPTRAELPRRNATRKEIGAHPVPSRPRLLRPP
jgi:hypothetical protein